MVEFVANTSEWYGIACVVGGTALAVLVIMVVCCAIIISKFSNKIWELKYIIEELKDIVERITTNEEDDC